MCIAAIINNQHGHALLITTAAFNSIITTLPFPDLHPALLRVEYLRPNLKDEILSQYSCPASSTNGRQSSQLPSLPFNYAAFNFIAAALPIEPSYLRLCRPNLKHEMLLIPLFCHQEGCLAFSSSCKWPHPPLHLFNSPRTKDMQAPIVHAASWQDDASQVAIELYRCSPDRRVMFWWSDLLLA